MKKSNLFILLIVAIVAITIFNFLTIGESSKDYTERLEQERKDKNGYMLSSNSPLIEEDKQNFTGLNYYPIDEEFKVTARIEKTNNKQPIFIESTTGEQLKYIPFATATFELRGQQHSVMLYQDWEEKDPNKLSLMFADETSAIETYGGGRYLDVMYRNTNSVIIDFNNAYNPFCHFNAEYSCPIPPRQNVLSIPIEAGEKIYKNH
ncbi:MAG: DUF1684 domain-containing protein [Roseivirga sp.]|jgi:hypothetical protein|uniref:DUF1684 domain-containing protein n=1 Tax=Roseivirga sp. TaxID=1964215 RepID=UPI001B0E749A|nr:DUF1684 domain-containing protein [Roseivirga sp.]MBO6496055.1 DUF1684 domain-containing protein [Roseivirga sp.]